MPGSLPMRILHNSSIFFGSLIGAGPDVVVKPDTVAVAPTLYRTR